MVWLVTMLMGVVVGAIVAGGDALGSEPIALALFVVPLTVGLFFDLPLIPIVTFILIALYLVARPSG